MSGRRNGSRCLARTAVLASLWISAGTAGAMQIRVVTANPPEAGIEELASEFGRRTGRNVEVQAMGTADINQLLASDDPADVVVATVASLDAVDQEDRFTGTRTGIGRVGIGVIVRRGASPPDVSTVEAVRQAALDADAVIYNTAGSGQYVDRMFDALGIGAAIRPKSARPGNAAETIQRMADGLGDEIGFGLVSEMSPHDGREIDLVGRLPEELQNYVVFQGVVLARSNDPEAARAFVGFLNTPEAREVFSRHGVD